MHRSERVSPFPIRLDSHRFLVRQAPAGSRGFSLHRDALLHGSWVKPGMEASAWLHTLFRSGALDIHCVSMYRACMIRKELVAASAEPLILSLLAKGESYGYALIQEVKARSGGKLNWTDGMLYPVLHRLEQRGLIRSRWGESETGRKRKYYSLKKEGKAVMAIHHEQWSLVDGVLSGLREEQYV
jgi:PadR family transcriptional regulator PadR